MKWLIPVLLVMVAGCSPLQHRQASGEDRLLITAKRIYLAPDAPPIDNAWVIVREGKIEAVGDSSAGPAEGISSTSACSGGVIVAGFQNSHVHLIDPAFADAAVRPPVDLEQSLDRMLTRYGFTTIVDTGSDMANTAALRQRIERGEIKGPAILTAGIPLFPKDGLPNYIRDLPPEFLRKLAQPADAREAVAVVGSNFALGANGTKLFVVTPQGNGEFKRMSSDIARAAAVETHRRGGLVMAHPTDPQGVRDAVAAGTDIIVHTTIDVPEATWDDALIGDMVARKVSVIPTLKLWGYEVDKANAPADVRESVIDVGRQQLRAFATAGGQVLFGTDVGYMADVDPTDEYVQMARAGLTPMQILASLTTAPADRWQEGERRGRVKPGFDADLVVLDGDPATDVRHFADVKCTIRRGREIFTREPRG
jgi:imidazolonepropionase-like amidohydrolase